MTTVQDKARAGADPARAARALGGETLESWASAWSLAFLRIMYGLLWLQQAAWKTPPDFGRGAGDGLWYWLNQAVQHPTWSLHHAFLAHVVLPNFVLFGWLTLATELFIGFTMTFGFLSRLGALVGLLQSINVALSVLRIPNEWPWSYYMLMGYGLLFLTSRAGHTLGLDGLLTRRLATVSPSGWIRRLLAFAIA